MREERPNICSRQCLNDYFFQGFLQAIPGMKDSKVVRFRLKRCNWVKNRNAIARSRSAELIPHT